MANKFLMLVVLCGLAASMVAAFDPNINFASYSWYLKRSGTNPVAPGKNHFGNSQNLGDGNNAGKNVWLAADGVHMTIQKIGNKWYCTEIQNNELLGYGKYYSVITGNFVKNDRNIVIGIFTYAIPETSLNKGFEEIDIEFARWGDPQQKLLSMSVHPVADDPKSYKEFDVKSTGNASYTTVTNWMPGKVIIQVYYGKVDISQTNGAVKPFAEMIYDGINMPIFENGHFIFNYWLMSGLPPSDGKNAEMVVNDFKFEPFSETDPDPPVDPCDGCPTNDECEICDVVEPCPPVEECEVCQVCEVCPPPVVPTKCDVNMVWTNKNKYCCNKL